MSTEGHLNEFGMPVGFPVPGWAPPPRPPREPMAGRYCRVEPLDVARHAEQLFHANAADREGRNWVYLPYGPFETLPAYRDWLTGFCLRADPLFHVVIDSESGEAAGLASYLNIRPEAGSIEVGHINYAPALQRTRAATEAMYLMMRRAFELGYRRYEWKCNALNGRSRAAAMRLGLSYEGVFRQMLVVKGRNRDSAWYAAIDSEWPRLREAFDQWLAPENFAGPRQRRSLASLTAPVLVARG